MSHILELESYQLENLISQRVNFVLFCHDRDQDSFKKEMSLAIFPHAIKGLDGALKVLKKRSFPLTHPIVLISTGDFAKSVAADLEKKGYENVCFYQASGGLNV